MCGYTLFQSLCKHVPDFSLYVAALDDEAYRLLAMAGDSRLIPIRLADIEAFDPEFARCRDNRSRVEYIFTLSPVLPLYLFHRHPEIQVLNYLDSDLFFCLFTRICGRNPVQGVRQAGDISTLLQF